METLPIPNHILHRLLNPNFQSRFSRGTGTFVQEPHVLIEYEIRALHNFIRLRNESFVMGMRITEPLILLICDGKSRGVSNCFLGVILPFNDKDLKALPSEGVYLLYSLVHIFVEVVPVHHRVKLELNPILLTQSRNLPHLIQMLAFPPSDLNIDILIERVTGNSNDIDILRRLLQKFLIQLTPIGDDGY